MKRILITGVDSYIGTSFETWIKQPSFEGMYQVDTVDMRGDGWKEKDFSGYDSVFHVAGIAHADVGKVSEEQKKLYYQVNCDLAVDTAKKAKREGVKQFIYMSSIIVYGEGASLREKRVITRETKPSPSNFYGDSKLKAEKNLQPLDNEKFRVVILRPPMIYGEGCKGNYQTLKKIALKVPMFPDFYNKKSVLAIENLCKFVCEIAKSGNGGIFFPQDSQCVSTADMVRNIAKDSKLFIWITPKLNWTIYICAVIPGKIGNLINKAFGTLFYEENRYEENIYE